MQRASENGSVDPSLDDLLAAPSPGAEESRRRPWFGTVGVALMALGVIVSLVFVYRDRGPQTEEFIVDRGDINMVVAARGTRRSTNLTSRW